MPSSKAADIQSGSSALFTAGKNGVEVYKDTYRQKTVFHFKAGLVVEEEDASEAYPSKAVNTPLVFLADGPKFKEENVEKGDFASVYCCRTQKLVHAVIGDHGRGDLGAGSLFLAKALLGQDPAPDDENKTGHPRLSTLQENFLYILYPGSGASDNIPENTTIKQTGQQLFEKWGGLARLGELYPACVPEAN